MSFRKKGTYKNIVYWKSVKAVAFIPLLSVFLMANNNHWRKKLMGKRNKEEVKAVHRITIAGFKQVPLTKTHTHIHINTHQLFLMICSHQLISLKKTSAKPMTSNIETIDFHTAKCTSIKIPERFSHFQKKLYLCKLFVLFTYLYVLKNDMYFLF